MIDPDWAHGFEAVFRRAVGNEDTFPARLICKDRVSDNSYNFVFLVRMATHEETWNVNPDGRISGFCDAAVIRQKPEPARTFGGWVNMYGNDDDQYMKSVYPNKSDADRLSIPSRIACVYVEGTYKVGDNLS